MKKSSIALVAILGTIFAVLSGLLNLHHWWEIGWDATSYHPLVPVFGLCAWFIVLVTYKVEDVDNLWMWMIPSFWLLYSVVQFMMVYGVV